MSASADPATWWLYLLACKDGRTYAGIALDLEARFRAHLAGTASKFTRANPPLQILGAQRFATKSEALKAEHALKRLSRPARLAWAGQWPHERPASANSPSPARRGRARGTLHSEP